MPADNDVNSNGNNGASNGRGADSWYMYQRLVLSDIERHERRQDELETKQADDCEKMRNQIAELKTQMAVLITKMAIAGGLAGLGVTLLVNAIIHLMGK